MFSTLLGQMPVSGEDIGHTRGAITIVLLNRHAVPIKSPSEKTSGVYESKSLRMSSDKIQCLQQRFLYFAVILLTNLMFLPISEKCLDL